MRRTSLGLILSAAAHAGAATAIWLGWPEPHPLAAAAELRAKASPEPPPLTPLTPPAPERLIELAIVELPPEPVDLVAPVAPPTAPQLAAAPRAPIVPAAVPAAAPRAPRIDSASSAALPGALEPAPTGAPPASEGARSALSMRNALPTRLVAPDLRKIAEAGPVAAPRLPVTSSELAPAGDGRFTSDQGTFVAKVGADGSVKIEDRPNLRVGLALPGRKAIGRALESWSKDPYGQTRDRDREKERGEVPSGAVDDAEEQRKRPGTVPLIGGSFDVTDWLMRLSGRDPYFSAKLAFMDRTREARAEIFLAHRHELLRGVVPMIRKQAAQAWAAARPAAQRRRELFELWDDCAETGEAELVTAGGQARLALLGFIRSHLPADSAEAYSARELAALNRKRTSRQPFAPYADATATPDSTAAPDAGSPPP